MAVPAYQELASLADFLGMGLPADALRAARTKQAPIVATGAGAGLVAPSGALDVAAIAATTLAVLVEVVVGGVPGVATWRWSADAGVTWTATVATPQAGATVALALPVLGTPTGLTVRFAGTLTTAARYEWTAVSAVGDCLRAANEEAYNYLARRFGYPLTTVPSDIVRDVCCIAAADVMAFCGYRPGAEVDQLLEGRAKAARGRLQAVRDNEVQPRVEESGTPRRAPKVVSRPRR